MAVKYHDDNAINELKMQRMRREATVLANEYLAGETKSLDRFHSDSRDWASEYEQRFSDHSKAGRKRDLYYSLNPNKLKKSPLYNNQSSSGVTKEDRINFLYYK